MDKDRLEKLTQEYLKGLQAKETYKYLKELFEEMRKMLYEEWQTADEQQYREIKSRLTVINQLEGLILSHIENGKIAKQDIEEIEK
ncbi:MAG: hypothetical protein D6831_02965 [Aquificota bacterium]|nr:MAG: hypothetical protein D6831_02965 [Aquificota bacterium]